MQCNVSPPTCDEKISVCNEVEISERATISINGSKNWDTNFKSKKYVDEAKRRNLKCGIENCNTDVTLCTDEYVCTLAKHNKGNLQIYEDEAKKRGLQCVIKETEITKSDEVVYFCPVSPKLDLSRWSKFNQPNCDKVFGKAKYIAINGQALFFPESCLSAFQLEETSSNSTGVSFLAKELELEL